jgi:pilus biogenesis lipoprotein CpaD
MKPRIIFSRTARLSPLLVVAALLAACEPNAKMMGTLKGPMPPVPPPIVVRDQHRHLAVALPWGGALGPAEAERIGVFLDRSAAGRPGSVHLTIAGNPSPPVIDEVIRQAFELGYREDMISVAPPRAMGAGRHMTLELVTAAYVPVLPNCPETAHLNILDSNNLVSSDLGCSTVSDLELQVANPRDLVRGEDGGETDSILTTAAIKRLQTDKLKKLDIQSTTASTGGGQ